MAWNVWLVDTTTGRNRVKVQPATTSWGRALDGSAGEKESTFLLRDPKVAELVTRARTTPLSKSVVVDWDGACVYAAPIRSRKYDRNEGTLTLNHEDYWSFLQRRLVVSDRSDNVAKSKSEHRGYGVGTIVRRLLREAITASPTSMFGLPIDLAADSASTTNRTWHGYQLASLQDAMQSILDLGNCPDADLLPSWDASGNLRLEFRVGGLSTDSQVWSVSDAQSNVLSATVTEDASRVTNSVFAVGEGQEQDMKVAYRANKASSYPAMESVLSFKQERDPAVLGLLAEEHLRVYGSPTEQYAVSVRADGEPNVGAIRLGMTSRLYFAGDPWMGSTSVSTRLIEFSGDLTDSVSLQFQPNGDL